MSDTENSRPGLIRAEEPSFGTDRGDRHHLSEDNYEAPREKDAGTETILHICEDDPVASQMGVTIYKTVPVAGESDGRPRRLLAMSLVGLTSLVLLAGL